MLVASLFLIGLVWACFGHVRAAGFIMAFALFAACAMRAFLPTALVPALAVRSRVVDCLFFAGFGLVTLVGVASVRL